MCGNATPAESAAWKDKLELRITAPDAGIPLFMLDLQNLLRNKRASARPKDLDDLQVLEHQAND